MQSGAITTVIPHTHHLLSTLQNTNTPDINLERDIINPELEGELALGMEVAEINTDKRFIINVSTIIISALLFLLILSWFDFMQTAFYTWLAPGSVDELVPPSVKLWYAILLTIFIIMLIVLIYYYSRNHIK